MPMAQVVLGGLLVGLGARLGSGCTSGHGICGLSRLSPRSLVATPTFNARRLLDRVCRPSSRRLKVTRLCARSSYLRSAWCSAWGCTFFGMTNAAKFKAFWTSLLSGSSLAFVMAGAITVGFLAFSVVKRRSRTFLGDELQVAASRASINRSSSATSIFGVGWGLSGVRPGPAIFNVGLFDLTAVIFVVSMAAGMAMDRLIRGMLAANPATEPATTPPVVADA